MIKIGRTFSGGKIFSGDISDGEISDGEILDDDFLGCWLIFLLIKHR